nr:MAG TPA: hypothetical protein [Bacteriophage sp.]
MSLFCARRFLCYKYLCRQKMVDKKKKNRYKG